MKRIWSLLERFITNWLFEFSLMSQLIKTCYSRNQHFSCRKIISYDMKSLTKNLHGSLRAFFTLNHSINVSRSFMQLIDIDSCSFQKDLPSCLFAFDVENVFCVARANYLVRSFNKALMFWRFYWFIC